MNLKEYMRLKDRTDSLRREADREEGALEQDRRKLQDHGCNTIKEAEKLLKRLEREEQELTEQCDREYRLLLANFPQLGE